MTFVFKHPTKYKKEKAITSDLFAIEECPNCDGSGQGSVQGKEHEERTEDCDICNNEN